MFGNVLQVLQMLRFRDAPFQSERRPVAAFIITRIQTGDYDRWRPMFDQDRPRAREKAQVQRVLRSVETPMRFSSTSSTRASRKRTKRVRVSSRQVCWNGLRTSTGRTF